MASLIKEPENRMRCFAMPTFLICLITYSGYGLADALAKADYVGDWISVYQTEMDAWANTLRIEEDRFLLCETAMCRDPVVGNKFEYFEDLLVLTVTREGVTDSKLVLGGYTNDLTSALFGTRFQYQNNVIVVGLPMVYEKESEPIENQNR